MTGLADTIDEYCGARRPGFGMVDGCTTRNILGGPQRGLTSGLMRIGSDWILYCLYYLIQFIEMSFAYYRYFKCQVNDNIV